MSTQLYTQARVTTTSKPSFTPVQTDLLQRKCACGQHMVAGSECEECRQKREGMMQRAAMSTTPVSSVPPIVHDVLSSPGQPLDSGTRVFMEPRFGHDFSQVRVHTDTRAAESARAVNALAYTVGRDVVFGAGQYALETSEGRGLMAHELTHVVQQGMWGSRRVQGKLEVSPSDDTYEREADVVAQQVLMRNEATPLASPISMLTSGQQHIQQKPILGPDCDSYGRCKIVEPLVHSKQIVNAALNALPSIARGKTTNGRTIDLLNKHFHTTDVTDASTILENYRRILSEISGSIHYFCHRDQSGDCQGTPEKSVQAHTDDIPGSDVHLCPNYFAVRCQEAARELAHELAHHVVGGTDFAYIDDAAYQILSSNDAMRNAESYAEFAREVFQGAVSCKDCSEEIGRRGKRY